MDKRGLPVPSQSSFSGATGSKFKGLLMRRQSSQVSAETEAPSPDIATSPSELSPQPVYGDPTQDQGDEVRFYVELTKLDGLKDTYSIDIRRLKGNLRSYKFLYDCITEYVLSLPSSSPISLNPSFLSLLDALTFNDEGSREGAEVCHVPVIAQKSLCGSLRCV